MSNKVMTCVVIGCGDRGMSVYAAMDKKFPDRFKVVGAADPDKDKLRRMQEVHGVAPEMCFESGEELLAKGKLADVAVIATLDRDHHKYAVPALDLGYHLLLEKPVSPIISECLEIAQAAKRNDRHVVVGHVLRYTAFYRKVKEILDSGILGDIVSVQACEAICYWHMAHSFVRGNWRNSAETSPLILQKCCHDFDTFVWLTGKKCKSVSSFGSLREFRPEKAPEGATMRCLDGCPHIDTCPYSVKGFYMKKLEEGNDEWPVNVVCTYPTMEKLENALKTGPYGRCVYHCDNDVVDHQVVNLLMEDDVTVSFTTNAFTTDMERRLDIMCTGGEILGEVDANSIRVRKFGEEEEFIDVSKLTDDLSGHSGGDVELVHDLIDLVLDGKVASGITSIDVSLESHYIALAAEESRVNGGKVINVPEFIAGK